MTLARIGTRGSQLALAQSGQVAEALAGVLGTPVPLVPLLSEGDDLRGPLTGLGTTGVFATRLREALLDGACELLVHSFKDLPVAEYPGLRVVAVPERADARDALCTRDGRTLAELPPNARIGTGSPRRAAALLRLRPDLRIEPIRGNVDTRLGTLDGGLDAVVLAAAGLARLGRQDAVAEFFDLDAVMPAPAQGALALEVREDAPAELLAALDALNDPETHAAAIAERAVLAELEAGCSAPISAWAEVANDRLRLRARVISPDGAALADASGEVAWVSAAGDEQRSASLALGHRAGAELRERMRADAALDGLVTS